MSAVGTGLIKLMTLKYKPDGYRTSLIQEHSKSQTMKIVRFVGSDNIRFKKLLGIFLNGEYRVTQRAAWPLSYIAIKHPELIQNHIAKLISRLNEPNLHPSIPRNILRIFQSINIPEKYHGTLLDICFKFIMNAAQPAAIRAFSISAAVNICKNYDELKKELVLVLDELKKYPQRPAISSRLKHAFKALK